MERKDAVVMNNPVRCLQDLYESHIDYESHQTYPKMQRTAGFTRGWNQNWKEQLDSYYTN